MNCLFPQPRHDYVESSYDEDKNKRTPVFVILALCLLFFLVLGALAVGGVALHYAREYCFLNKSFVNRKLRTENGNVNCDGCS